MRPPIIVADDDIDVFETIADAGRYLEPIDVRRGFRIYDRDGTPLSARITRKFLVENVKLVEKEGAAADPDELLRILSVFLSQREQLPATSYRDMTLDELLACADI